MRKRLAGLAVWVAVLASAPAAMANPSVEYVGPGGTQGACAIAAYQPVLSLAPLPQHAFYEGTLNGCTGAAASAQRSIEVCMMDTYVGVLWQTCTATSYAVSNFTAWGSCNVQSFYGHTYGDVYNTVTIAALLLNGQTWTRYAISPAMQPKFYAGQAEDCNASWYGKGFYFS